MAAPPLRNCSTYCTAAYAALMLQVHCICAVNMQYKCSTLWFNVLDHSICCFGAAGLLQLCCRSEVQLQHMYCQTAYADYVLHLYKKCAANTYKILFLYRLKTTYAAFVLQMDLDFVQCLP